MSNTERIQVEIKSDHSKARLSYGGYEFEIPLQNWSANGGLSLTIPWDWVDLILRHPDSDQPPVSNPHFYYWDQPLSNPIQTETAE